MSDVFLVFFALWAGGAAGFVMGAEITRIRHIRITSAATIEVLISTNRRALWITADAREVLRITDIGVLRINDMGAINHG
jgi:hypothetical protein